MQGNGDSDGSNTGNSASDIGAMMEVHIARCVCRTRTATPNYLGFIRLYTDLHLSRTVHISSPNGDTRTYGQ